MGLHTKEALVDISWTHLQCEPDFLVIHRFSFSVPYCPSRYARIQNRRHVGGAERVVRKPLGPSQGQEFDHI